MYNKNNPVEAIMVEVHTYRNVSGNHFKEYRIETWYYPVEDCYKILGKYGRIGNVNMVADKGSRQTINQANSLLSKCIDERLKKGYKFHSSENNGDYKMINAIQKINKLHRSNYLSENKHSKLMELLTSKDNETVTMAVNIVSSKYEPILARG